MNFLIVTEPDDLHGVVVTLALQYFDHQVVNLFSADFPSQQKNSIFIDQKEYRCKTVDDFQTLHHAGYDVVWWRRPRFPHLNPDLVHPDDFKFQRRETILFHENFTHQLAPGAWWVNRKEAAIRANYKLLQLKVASEVGMTIPTTLCSNNKEDILQFYYHHQKQGVIYKPLSYQFWEQDKGIKVVYTSKITDAHMLEQFQNHLFPGIFQEQISKKYELRVTCFGDYLISAKLTTPGYSETPQDWRALTMDQIQVEPYVLPERLKQQIRFLMRELGIVFGCIDIIVTPEDDYIFLEINEQGQFLFLEECCEDLPMLDTFVYFLMQQTIDFHWIKRHNLHRIRNYRQYISKIYQENLKHHVRTYSPMS